MRTREEIEREDNFRSDWRPNSTMQRLALEVLLDIRELLTQERKSE